MVIGKRCIGVLAAMSLVSVCSGRAMGAEEAFTLDPTHTFPSFEADHMGMSIWRGKMNKTTGTVVLDRAAQRGTLRVRIDLDSIDFGLDALNRWAVGPQFFDTVQNREATYDGTLTGFKNGAPTRVEGELTLHGVKHPLTLTINSFACKTHPMLHRQWCGADASAVFSRDDFGLSAGKDYGFKMEVALRIQVEAIKDAS